MEPVSDPDLAPPEYEHVHCPEALLSLAAGSVLSVLPCPPSSPSFLSRARSIPCCRSSSTTSTCSSIPQSTTSMTIDMASTSATVQSPVLSASAATTTSTSSSCLPSSSLSLASLTEFTIGCTDTEEKQLQPYEMKDSWPTTKDEKKNAAADMGSRHHHAASPYRPPARSLQPGLIHFLRTICTQAKVSELALVISLIYVDRLKKVLLTSMARGDPDTPFKIILSALLVVKKFLDEDSFGLNRLFSKITLYTLSDINTMERSFLGLLKYSLFVTEEEIAQFLQCHEQELHGLDILRTSTRSAIAA